MSGLQRVNTETPGRLTFGSGLTKTSTTVTNDGRTQIHFHRTPADLAARFGQFLSPSHAPPEPKVPKERRPSIATAIHNVNAVPTTASTETEDEKKTRQPSVRLGAAGGGTGTGICTGAASSPSPVEGEREKPPNPRLNIAIHIVGSRGDVQPFIPIAQILTQPPYNHRVRICTHPVFKNFVESKGLEFFSIGGDPEALMAYMVKNPGLLPSMESMKAGEVGKRRKEMAEIMEGCWRGCIEPRRPQGFSSSPSSSSPGGSAGSDNNNGGGPPIGEMKRRRPTASDITLTGDLFLADVIIANPPSMAHIHCAEKLGIPLHMVFTMPWSPTSAFHHPLASMSYGQSETAVANFLSFIMMELLTWQGLNDIINRFRSKSLKLDPISPLWGNQLLTRLRVPYTYLWSQSLIPKPADWGQNLNITGFSFMEGTKGYEPPRELAEFLEEGKRQQREEKGMRKKGTVYIGFGSIVVDDPAALTKLIFEAVAKAGVRAIVSRGWGGMGAGDAVPEDVYMVGDCPHDWLFRRVDCVVHHGGAGTTAAGIAAGKPTVVVPFFGDQPFWGQMIAAAGAGPDPTPFKSLTADILAESIRFALTDGAQEAAMRIAAQVAVEDGARDASRDIVEHIKVEDMRCDLCPELLAVWTHKKTGAHLSTFAVLCLVDSEVMQVKDFKLLRHMRWYVDEGAESPLLGGLAAVAGFFTEMGSATKDFADRLRAIDNAKKMKKKKKRDSSTSSGGEEGEGEGEEGGELDAQRAVFAGGPGAVSPKHMEKFAKKIARKSPSSATFVHTETGGLELNSDASLATGQGKKKNKRGNAYLRSRATGRYALSMGKVAAKLPGSFFYNLANGCRNFPSYAWSDIDARRREEIRGLGSGLKVAGTELGMGLFKAVTDLGVRPYKGAKKDGVRGLGRGVVQGFVGIFCNVGSAVYGVPGYTLKGVEKELHKRHMSELKAEIILIRLKQGSADFREATCEQRKEVISRWKRLYNC